MSQIEHEAARVAAAFGIGKWGFDKKKGPLFHFECLKVRSNLRCAITETDAQIVEISARDYYGRYLEVWLGGEKWHIAFPYSQEILPETIEFMTRGLYRLGFEDQTVLSQLPSLSYTEQMELRLELPREFWPARWKEEAYTSTNGKP